MAATVPAADADAVADAATADGSGNVLVSTFQKHIEDMRGLTLCKICLRPFYEPFTLACGHTYCYSCLRDWLHGPREQRLQKGCPDCRQKIEAEPAPNYTLRDLVHLFVNRVELLPEDESVDEHERGKRAEAKVLADDRKGSGLFRGLFKRTRLPLLGFDRVYRDAADGVDRCPKCMWEMEEGECNSCGWPRISDDEDDYDSAEDLAELHFMDGFPPRYDGALISRHYGYSDDDDDGTDQSGEEDESGQEDDEHDSELDDFIDDEDEDDYPSEHDHDDDTGLSDLTDRYGAYPTSRLQHHFEFRMSTDIDDDDDDDDDDDVDDDDDDEGSNLYPASVNTRTRMRPNVPSDASLAEDGSGSETVTPVATNYGNDTDTTPRRMTFHSFNMWSDDDEENGSSGDEFDDADDGEGEDEGGDEDGDDNDNNNDDDSDAVVRAASASRALKRARARRVVESDEEDGQESMSAADSQASGSSSAATTAQSVASRLNRLRARRAHNSGSRFMGHRAFSPQPTRRTALSPNVWGRRGAGRAQAQAHPYMRVR